MEIPRKIVETIKAETVTVHAKVCDSASYALCGPNGQVIAERNDDYVPSFFPGEHYGDYIILEINLETGEIVNWKKPDPACVASAFNLLQEDE